MTDQFFNSDLIKFHMALGEKTTLPSFEDSMYLQAMLLSRQEVSREELNTSSYKYISRDDDFCVFGVKYQDSFVLWFDDYFIDEESFSYNNDVSPIALEVFKPNLTVLSSEIVIGNPLSIEKVHSVLNENVTGEIVPIHLGANRMLIDCYLDQFELIFSLNNGKLVSTSLLEIAKPAQTIL